MEYEKSSSAEALENAVESYRSAVTLDVFSLNSRIELGRLELETGRPDLGITTLKAALALTNENITARRRLARCWTDLCASELLDPETRRTAAVQAKAEGILPSFWPTGPLSFPHPTGKEEPNSTFRPPPVKGWSGMNTWNGSRPPPPCTVRARRLKTC